MMKAILFSSTMRHIRITFSLFILIAGNLSQVYCQQDIDLQLHKKESVNHKIRHYHIAGDEYFTASQNIHILAVPRSSLGIEYKIDMAWSDSLLYPTSKFGEQSDAMVAINGGFFNIAEGGSVSFLEYDDQMVSNRSWRGDTPDKKTNLDGALIILKTGKIIIEDARSSDIYLNSPKEKAVLITGPVLIRKGIQNELLDGNFVNKRHPRTCIGITQEDILLIIVDGRHLEAKGMNLHELQDFLSGLDCRDAINLDGGGSTTLWLNTETYKGVANCPSDNKNFDNKGERKVANVILLNEIRKAL